MNIMLQKFGSLADNSEDCIQEVSDESYQDVTVTVTDEEIENQNNNYVCEKEVKYD
jgi:hypothetical protein